MNFILPFSGTDSRGVTPAYSTTGFTPSQTPSSNFGTGDNYQQSWSGTPRTPKQQHTPQMHGHHGKNNRQYNQHDGKQRQSSGGRHHRR